MCCSIESGEYLGDISALCIIHLPPPSPFPILLLAGSGSQILVYDLSSGKLVSSPIQVFDGIRVHGIISDDDTRIVVFGERRVKLLSFQFHPDIRFKLVHSLPNFPHWILDVCFLKDNCIAVGCTDNSLYFTDLSTYNVFAHVQSDNKCLLYSMRMFGNDIATLRIASGTIFNQILVWKVVVCQNNDVAHPTPKYKDVSISRLVGHEGSIFRIAWFPNGLKLVSVSDDRSARIWNVLPVNEDSTSDHVTGPVLFGHSARIWDCCVFDTGIITAGEDCTCRVWDHNGTELNQIKEHIGRGIWRCLYDPTSSLLVTAGFDSAIKVHQIPSSKGVGGIVSSKNVDANEEVFALSLPNSSGHVLMDSKSEYVRCLQFSGRDSLYVATNNGFLYHASLCNDGAVKWTELVCIGDGAPIICMDLLSERSSSPCANRYEDCIIAIGDGKGNMTIVRVVVGTGGSNPVAECTLTWSAEKERHLLGVHWCRSSDNRRFVFTADPGGRLKLWLLCHDLTSAAKESCNALLIAEYASCFGRRIMCVDASFTEELLVCGDIRGNLLLFSLPGDLLPCSITSVATEVEASSPVNYFKGAHGVSSVCSVSVVGLCSNDQVEIQSTGADGCICYLQHDRNMVKLDFIGMKQVKELSAVRSIFTAHHSDGNYAVGFASENFIIWNLTSETKVTQIKCGGWRRPHAYYLGDFLEMMNCFSFVKNDVIYVHRCWVPKSDNQVYPRNLHLQFHGREIHSLCFIGGYSDENEGLASGSSWIATGCEDGTVRLTRYGKGTENWSSSKYLGEHVGGSAVRSICYVSKIHKFEQQDSIDMPNADYYKQNMNLDVSENSSILISVGSKRVVTAWKQILKMGKKSCLGAPCHESINNMSENSTVSSLETIPSVSFQWLSTDMPSKHTNSANRKNTKKVLEGAALHHPSSISLSDAMSTGPPSSECRKEESNLCHEEDNRENDWRYLDVTAFLVKDADSRSTVCFVIVACSDATVTLRALVLPSRLWFDIASFGPLSSPVLALQHVVVPMLSSRGSIYLAISGSTDGSVSFWDLTKCVEKFMLRISGLEMESDMEFQKRPRTGRGSQGGRWWQSIDNHFTKKKNKKQGDDKGGSSLGVGVSKGGECNSYLLASNTEFVDATGNNGHASTSESKNGCHISEVQECDPAYYHEDCGSKKDEQTSTEALAALHVLSNMHQSGVNSIHVSDIMLSEDSSRCSFHVVSGGDDQAINCHRCDFEVIDTKDKSTHKRNNEKINFTVLPPSTACNNIHRCLILNHQMQFIHVEKISSAHSSAVKGVWTDGIWVFSVGLDQRVRCWKLSHDRLTEYTHLIISVPEPESLDVKACGRNHYQIVVAGRGMQMVEFFAASRTSSGVELAPGSK